MNRPLNILLVGLTKDNNLGDPIIAESVEYAIRKFYPYANIEYACLDEFDHKGIFWIRVLSKLQRMYNIPPFKTLNLLYKRYFKKILKNKDIGILTGGGLIKYKNQFFNGITGLIEAAEDLGVPIAINSVGVEGYDATNKKCLALKKVLKSHAVKYVSTRDDLTTLIEKYYDHRPEIPVIGTADPAILVSEEYDKSQSVKNSIGIGVCRFSIFEEYGCSQSADEIHDLYLNTILRLIERGNSIELFTNGGQSDNVYAKALQEELASKGYDISLKIPKTSEELVKIISLFSQIIAVRMHACILAYSLGIPTVGLVWNDKLQFWAQKTEQSKNFLRENDITVEKIIECIDSTGDFKSTTQPLRTSLQNDFICNIKEILNIVK